MTEHTPQPTKGGSYIRTEDGSLTAVEQPIVAEPVAPRAAEAEAGQPAPHSATTKGGK